MDQCIQYLNSIDHEKALVVIAESLGQELVPNIHSNANVVAIYILSDNNSHHHEQWTKKWDKIKDVYTEIKPICDASQSIIKQQNQDSISMTLIPKDEETATKNLNELDHTFMYTKIFKEILFEIKDDENTIKNFINFCRIGENKTSPNINTFEKDYNAQKAIYWYTLTPITYEVLNRALRTLEVDTIMKMGFFIRDLHHQIQQLYEEQVDNYNNQSFKVYRGQHLSEKDFKKLQETKGGIISFNNFLSTSRQSDVCEYFGAGSETRGLIGIHFVINVNPTVSSSPFADIHQLSSYEDENEILFSMHTVFRIDEIKEIDKANRIYQVDLRLTDDDEQLRILTERISEEAKGKNGWERLGNLLLAIGEPNKAEELYCARLEQTSEESEKALHYHQLGYIKTDQGKYEEAIQNYEKALKINEKSLPPTHEYLAYSYNNIGTVYVLSGQYSKALSFLEKALEIRQKACPTDESELGTCYGNIASVYDEMGDYSKALLFHEKARETYEKILPENHPTLATSYQNIGSVHASTGEYSKALHFMKKALKIREKTLPVNHPNLPVSYNNIASVYESMGNYKEALELYEKAGEIFENVLPANHPSLAAIYNNIALVYDKMGNYDKALSYQERALNIRQNALPINQPSLASSYNNIASVYDSMGKYNEALEFYKKAGEILENVLPTNHPNLAGFCNNIALVYDKVGNYDTALSYHKRALEIRQNALSINQPNLASSYNNIALVYLHMGDYSKALEFYIKGGEILEKILPENHRNLAAYYNNIALVYKNIHNYPTALLYYKRALNILQCLLSSEDLQLQEVQRNIEIVQEKL
ncbi:unnamed protein product [Adineta steineri]|uniref:ADP ribosyltransferase domain-containing protein n=1 Tax=Adineta steineri TaxID=433720 RepID=A0A813SC03_9BILA|nr:unnamed protein product [Adineta steineri]CAF0992893.1 unnamed protein product [Adineta steineri]CAF4127915.1 unnamed protein product [Adineta steineri]